MSSSTKRSQTPGGVLGDAAPLLFAVPVLIVVAVGWAALHLAARVDDRPAPPGNPINLGTGLADGSVKWTTTTTVIAVAIAVVVVLLAVLIGLGVRKLVRRGTRIDRAARYMGRGRQIEGLTAKGAGGVAKRLGVAGEPGLVLGRAVYNGQPLYQDWESTAVDIWGTRAGKSSTRAIPAIVAAPGAVIATSNKRDLVDATRLPRSSKGTVWVFDPQEIVGESPTWWWNPLSYVTDEAKATALASLFIGASREPGARTDAFFDGQGRNLISVLLLAAATGSKPITEVYVWLSRPNDDEPLRILQTAGYEMQAVTLNGIVTSPEKQRGGVYGTAQLIMSFLANRRVTTWVTPPGRGPRPEFVPADFVRSADTLHSLSKEGDGADAGPLIATMTAIICEAAEKYAMTQPAGRLPVPLVVVLDEAANVCRWNQLPNLYSHYGSRGILISTFLQSWAQGEDAWGTGMTKMWEAANIAIYGGGSNETKFLEMLSQVVGEYEHSQVSTSRQAGGGRSTNHQLHTDRILSVADLGAMPRGRFVILASGCVPTLGRTQPWFKSKHKDAIEASIAAAKSADV
jgi:type IV secretory pathway TraG/TraD family ATPase VirD4